MSANTAPRSGQPARGVSAGISDVYPCLYYRNAPAAIRWLEQAFGFRKRMAVDGPDGTIVHAELSFGSTVIMVSTSKPDHGWVSPLDLGAVNQLLCIYVEDVDAHYERARAAGAVILGEPRDTDYGSRGYECKDPEGHIWSFGTYRPGAYWAAR